MNNHLLIAGDSSQKRVTAPNKIYLSTISSFFSSILSIHSPLSVRTSVPPLPRSTVVQSGNEVLVHIGTSDGEDSCRV